MMKVLVADRSMTLRNSLIRIVQSMPMLKEVREVESFEQLDRVTRCDPPDLILLDLFLPGGEGFSMIDKTFAASKNSEVVVLLDSYDADLAMKAKRRGAKAVLSKSENLLVAMLSLNVKTLNASRGKEKLRFNI